MIRQALMHLSLAAMLAAPLAVNAEVFMCVDPVTGKKSFTDRACPAAEPGQKVKVEPVNFGSGNAAKRGEATWSSDRDTSRTGTGNLSAHQRRLNAARTTGYLPAQR